MKNFYLLLLSLIIAQKSYSQTNTFPTSGSVGINTTSPLYPLDVHAANQRLYYSLGSAYLRVEGNGTTNNTGSNIYLNSASTRAGDVFKKVGMNANKSTDNTANFQIFRMDEGDVDKGLFYQYSDPIGHRFLTAVSRTANSTTEVMRISPEGRISIGSTPVSSAAFSLSTSLTRGNNNYGIFNSGLITGTSQSYYYLNHSRVNTQSDSVITLPLVAHFTATQGTVDANTNIATQTAFWAANSLLKGNHIHGFRGSIPIGTNNWNLFMDGTANNYLAGNLGIGLLNPLSPLHVNGIIRSDGGIGLGTSTLVNGGETFNIKNSKNISGTTTGHGIFTDGVIQNTLNAANLYTSYAQSIASSSLSSLVHYLAQQGNVAGSVTSQTGFYVSSTLDKGTNVYGFRGLVKSDSISKRWNLYMDGNANNYLAGNLGIGLGMTNPLAPLHVNGVIRTDVGIALGASSVLNSDQSFNIRNSKTMSGAATAHGIYTDGVVQSGVTTVNLYTSNAQTTAASNLSFLTHYNAQQGGVIGNVTSQTGFFVSENLTRGTNVFAFRGMVKSDSITKRWNLYMDGTASNYLKGNLGIGTTNIPTDYKVAIAGNMIVEKIKVKKQVGGAWPDYVFSPSYKLPSLDEVEQFTKMHSHLPEIPSAKEIETEGQDLGEMNRLLLKKVEELTLYLIEERKTNIDQGAQLKQLQEEVNQLKKNLK